MSQQASPCLAPESKNKIKKHVRNTFEITLIIPDDEMDKMRLLKATHDGDSDFHTSTNKHFDIDLINSVKLSMLWWPCM